MFYRYTRRHHIIYVLNLKHSILCQISLTIDLDDLHEFNESLVEAVIENTRRFSNLFSDVIVELLPTYKEHASVAKDSLDVYIEHRLMMESRLRNTNEQRDSHNRFPPELIKRLYVLHQQH